MKGGSGELYLMDTEYQFGKMERAGDGCGDDCTTMRMCLRPLNCTLKNDEKDKSYVMYIRHSSPGDLGYFHVSTVLGTNGCSVPAG